MVSEANLEYIDEAGYKYITALDKNQIAKVPGVTLGLFDSSDIERTIEQVTEAGFERYDENLYSRDLGDGGRKRHIICFNSTLATSERENREERIRESVAYLKEEEEDEARGVEIRRQLRRGLMKKLGKLKVGGYLPYHLEPIIVSR